MQYMNNTKNNEGGYVTNCLLSVRGDQVGPMFDFIKEGYCVARLDRYAIVPKEEYERLLEIEKGGIIG